MYSVAKTPLPTTIFVLFGAMITSPAFAASIQLATCGPSGCTCQVSGESLEVIATQVPAASFPQGYEDMTLVLVEGQFHWSTLSPAQIDRKYGGSGSCPLEVSQTSGLQDGFWQISVGTTDTSGCKMVGGHVPAGGISGASRHVEWGREFHPDKLFMESAGVVRWSKTGLQTWRGVVVDERMSANGGSSGASVVHTMRVDSSTKISGSTVFEFELNLPGLDAAAASIIAGMQCRTVTPFVARKVE